MWNDGPAFVEVGRSATDFICFCVHCLFWQLRVREHSSLGPFVEDLSRLVCT